MKYLSQIKTLSLFYRLDICECDVQMKKLISAVDFVDGLLFKVLYNELCIRTTFLNYTQNEP